MRSWCGDTGLRNGTNWEAEKSEGWGEAALAVESQDLVTDWMWLEGASG